MIDGIAIHRIGELINHSMLTNTQVLIRKPDRKMSYINGEDGSETTIHSE